MIPLFFPDSIEIGSLEGLMLWCPEMKPVKTGIGMVMHNFHGLKTTTYHCVADVVTEL